MATDTQTIAPVEIESLLSKRRKTLVVDPLSSDNPITDQVLGICSALAITAKIDPTLLMSISVLFAIIFSNLLTSLIRHLVPNRVRIIV